MTKVYFGVATIKKTGLRYEYLYKLSWAKKYYSFDNGYSWNTSKATAFKKAEKDGRLTRRADLANDYNLIEVPDGKWSGKDPIPALGTRVNCKINSIGPGKVVGYALCDGFVGVHVELDCAPEWYTKQNNGKPFENVAMVFGVEIEPLRKATETDPETCEDRGYRCCERLPAERHSARYGYAQASEYY